MSAVRTLLTVAVAAAILGLSLPAMADARADRTEATLDSAAARVTDAAAELAANEDPVLPTERGASRTVTLTLPRAGMADAEVAYFSLGGRPDASNPSVIGYRVVGRPPQQIETRTRFLTGPRPLVLSPGRHTLRLTLVAQGGRVGVRVDRPGRPTTSPDSIADAPGASASRPP